MLNREREQEIITILEGTNGFVTVKRLCDALFASESSIRRDLKSLEERGLIKRSYGGASLKTNGSGIITFNNRTRQNIKAKQLIAAKAASIIKEGDIVFLDQSSTSFYLASELVNRKSLTVVTNNIEIMMRLSNSAVKIISSGGYLSDENRNCLIGGDAQATFGRVFANTVFFSVKALSHDGVACDCSREEIIVREAMFKNSAKKILLCDSSKFGERAAYKQCDLVDVDCLISEESNAQRFAQFKDRVELL